MHKKTLGLHDLRDHLQGLLDKVGTTKFPRAKSLFLKEVDIVDPDGNSITSEDVDFLATATATLTRKPSSKQLTLSLKMQKMTKTKRTRTMSLFLGRILLKQKMMNQNQNPNSV